MSETITRGEVRVLHFGDVHLGSAFLSAAPRKSAERRRAQHEALNRIFRYIREQEVQIALITGDLFVEEDLADETANYLIRSMRALSECCFFIFPGEGDRYTEHSFYASGRLPGNVHVFSKREASAIRIPDLGITVAGSAVTEEEAPPSPLAPIVHEEGDVLLLGGYRKIVPSDEEIAGSGALYVALSGSPDYRAREIGGVTVAYSGSPESRNYNDIGVGGANLLMIVDEAGARRAHIKRMEFGTAVSVSHEIDVSEMKTDSDLITAITRLVRDGGLGRNAILRVVLVGETTPGFRIPREFDDSSFGLMIFSVLNLTTPRLDPQLKRDMSAKGELYRLLEPKIENGTDAERAAAARALTIGLTALEGKDIDHL